LLSMTRLLGPILGYRHRQPPGFRRTALCEAPNWG
jgi:hypothetical protein